MITHAITAEQQNVASAMHHSKTQLLFWPLDLVTEKRFDKKFEDDGLKRLLACAWSSRYVDEHGDNRDEGNICVMCSEMPVSVRLRCIWTTLC